MSTDTADIVAALIGIPLIVGLSAMIWLRWDDVRRIK